MEKAEKKVFYLGKRKYSIDADEKGEREGLSYYKCFTIWKDDEYWSVVGIGITPWVEEKWKQGQVDLGKFLLQVSPYIFKIGIYNSEINKIDTGGKIQKNYLFVDRVPQNSEEKQTFSTPDETIAYYKKQVEEIDNPKIGFL